MSTTLERQDIGKVSLVRRPRGVALLNNSPITFLSFEVEKRSHFTVDIWELELEYWKQPEGLDVTYWADAIGVIVELKIGTLQDSQDVGAAPSAIVSLIIGQVDDVDLDPIRGIIKLHGRSLAAKFIDTKTTNKWLNKTASQIVTMLAQGQDLTPNVTPTKVPVGHYYDDDYADLSRSISEWELLTFLAQREGFECYVTGTTLFFGPQTPDPNPFAVWMQLDTEGNVWSNALRLSLKRSLTLAQDITVTVISHDYWSGDQIRATANRRSKALGGARHVTPQTKQGYILRRAGLTPEQAQQLASSTLEDLSRFERNVEIDLEGSPLMTVQRQIIFSETGSSFDQRYFVDRVVHKFSWAAGYEMTVHGKNIPPTSTELLVQGTPAEISPP